MVFICLVYAAGYVEDSGPPSAVTDFKDRIRHVPSFTATRGRNISVSWVHASLLLECYEESLV